MGESRLVSQRLEGDRCETPDDVVRWMGALQAQDYGQALWAIGVRTTATTLAEVEKAIADRTIVRTWPMRSTLHVVPPEDARWMLKLSETRRVAADRRRMTQLELDVPLVERCKDLFGQALQGGKKLTRAGMLEVLEHAGIKTDGQRGYHILWYAAQTGLICLGPMDGKQQTFVLLEEWVPKSRKLSREESLAELAARYFRSHGPATVKDFAWWAGLTLTEARQGLEASRSGLIATHQDGRDYWMSEAGAKKPRRGVFLLPGFDEFLLGYQDRSAVLSAAASPKIVPGNNGVFKPIVVVDDQVVGTWQRTLKKKAVEVTVHLFDDAACDEDALEQAADRYAHFVGLPVSTFKLGVG